MKEYCTSNRKKTRRKNVVLLLLDSGSISNCTGNSASFGVDDSSLPSPVMAVVETSPAAGENTVRLKRKADELTTTGHADQQQRVHAEDDTAKTTEPPTPPAAAAAVPDLPATFLANVLNFLPYNEVRSSLLAGKTLAIDVATNVRMLLMPSSSSSFTPVGETERRQQR